MPNTPLSQMPLRGNENLQNLIVCHWWLNRQPLGSQSHFLRCQSIMFSRTCQHGHFKQTDIHCQMQPFRSRLWKAFQEHQKRIVTTALQFHKWIPLQVVVTFTTWIHPQDRTFCRCHAKKRLADSFNERWRTRKCTRWVHCSPSIRTYCIQGTRFSLTACVLKKTLSTRWPRKLSQFNRYPLQRHE